MLTNREKEIATMISWGYSEKEIAVLLCISENTCNVHVTNIHTKTGLQKNSEITAAVMFKKYALPVIDLPEAIRRRIAAALLVISLTGIVFGSELVRTFRAQRTATTQTARTISRARKSEYQLKTLAA